MAIAVRMSKPWRPLTPAEADKVAGNLGVYQLANDAGDILYIGAATGRSLFGLRGEIREKAAEPPEGATQFRLEVNTSYRTRHRELLMAYQFDHDGRLPPLQPAEDGRGLGKLSPG
ncbi:MAG: hypothetical protein KDC18_01870 [Alphaproteobacteria bacterium]|nr:hypothetical protein [Alphaproteobacteria bacterium]MCB9930445.1 hypothetical protein [Alphaproteobacteria bacterium]